ncbi:MAG: hypothetical protein KBA81_00755 [Rhabdochlamydiaceae bacterium]|nr:hypothetical protein [Rhabdochlamydiaceae bacterium]
MTTFQTLQEGLSDSRHLGTTLFAPQEWLYKEVQPILAPFKGDILGKELIEKIARIALIFLIPVVYLSTALGYTYNFAAHYLNTLESQPKKVDSELPSHVQDQASVSPELSTHSLVQVPKESPEENIYQNLMLEVDELHREYDLIFQQEGLPGLRGEKKDQLMRQFQKLGKKITPHQDKEEMKSVCKFFFQARNQFFAAIRQRSALIQAPLRMQDDGTIPIPDKGDCFYIAASVAYKLYVSQDRSMDGSDLTLDPKQLRTDIVNWQRENIEQDRELKGLISAGISIYVMDKVQEIQGIGASIEMIASFGEDTAALEQQIKHIQQLILPYQQEETRFEHYFTEVSKEGFWGGVAEFYAFSKIYNVSILVRERSMFREKPENECFRFNVGAPKQMTIWWIDGHHFEVKID